MITSKMPPLLSLNSTIKSEDKYVFISYSHADSEHVYQDLNCLHERGLRFWYDNELKAGNEWNDKAEQVMRNENCVGVVFYNSENSFPSEAIQKEIEFYNEIRKDREDYVCVSVNLGLRNTNEIVRDIYCSLATSDAKELEFRFPQTRAELVLSTFKNNVIFISRPRDVMETGHLDKIIDALTEKGVVLGNDNLLLEMQKLSSFINNGGVLTWSFGRYPQRVTSNVNELRFSPDNDYETNGHHYRVEKKQVFEFQPVFWDYAEIDCEGVMTLISSDCLDYMQGGDLLDAWTKNAFRDAVFCENENEILSGEPFIAGSNFFKRNEALKQTQYSDYAKSKLKNGDVSCVWLSDLVSSTPAKQSCASLQGGILGRGISTKECAGVRPVIQIDAKKFIEYAKTL